MSTNVSTKRQAAILKKKLLSFAVLNAKKATFYVIHEDFGIFPIFKFCPTWAAQKMFWVNFCVLDENLT